MKENEIKAATSVVETLANSPKVAVATATAPVAIGAAAKLEIIQGWLSVVSMSVGIVTALVVLGVWMIKLEQAWRDRK